MRAVSSTTTTTTTSIFENAAADDNNDYYKVWIDIAFLAIFVLQIAFNSYYLIQKINQYYKLLRHNKTIMEISADTQAELNNAT
jgi:hypothetical protein